MASYALYLSIFLIAISTATGLKCYSCSGFACNYGFFSFTYSEADCDIKTGSSVLDSLTSLVPAQCVKITGKDESGSSFVARNCSTYTGQIACNAIASAMELGSNVKDLECFTCTSDYCNSATKFTGMAAIGLIVACFAFLF